MASALPLRPNLDWLRKTARQRLRERRTVEPHAKLAHAQLDLARELGFSSWRALKAHVEELARQDAFGDDSADVAAFLRAVGSGDVEVVRASLASRPRLLNAAGPHPYWEGRPQPLHVAIETARRDMFDLLLDAGADLNGSNAGYEHTSPLALAMLWNQPDMRDALLARGARVGLVEALLLGDDALVARMLRRGKSALPRYKPNGGSILAMARTPFAIDRLLALDAAHDTKDRWGTPPLEAFSRLGAAGEPLVRHLAAKGLGVTAAEYARMGDRASLERLLAADVERVRSHDVLREAAGFGHHELAQWLLDQGARVNPTSPSWSALHSAAWEGDLRMVKLLVAAGADVALRETEHHATAAGCATVAIEVTNNPACRDVANFLASVERGEASRRAE